MGVSTVLRYFFYAFPARSLCVSASRLPWVRCYLQTGREMGSAFLYGVIAIGRSLSREVFDIGGFA